ncbi:MAG: polysulfide reductase NrfD [Solirubrobacterales bacterium]|nr:polysulfide reductase NrfD [Solirubrobacterales bacterium]
MNVTHHGMGDGASADSRAGAPAGTEIRTYHGQPVIKEPIWTWEIPCYFFTGGLAGASAGLAYMSSLRGNDVLARRAWATALASVAVSPALLTSDLGRPRRVMNMLRMFKVTSPMSVGSWLLSASGASTAIAAAHAWTGSFAGAARVARPAAALLGLPLSTYTAALVTNTAVPVWHGSRRLLPFVFASGAALSAGAAAVAVTPVRHARAARRLALVSAALELGCKELMERRLGDLGEPYKHAASFKFGRLGQALIAGGAGVLYGRGGRSRAAAAVAGAMLCAGALSARWSVFEAGFQSAADPKYVVGPQRDAIRRGERRGASRTEPHISAPQPAVGSPATAPAVVDEQREAAARPATPR